MDECFIKFADKRQVFFESFEFHNIYRGLLAGTKHDWTEHLLIDFSKPLPKGMYLKLDDNCFVPNHCLSQDEWLTVREFRPFRYCLKVHNIDSQLTVNWLDFAPPQDIPLLDYIEKHTSGIHFVDYAEKINW